MSHIATTLEQVKTEAAEHPIWSCRLLRACQRGHLSLADYRYVFGQYAHYSRNFTRYLSAAMSRCENDFYRARLSANLWEEGGMLEPKDRHSQIFRDFLTRALGVDAAEVHLDPATLRFVDRYFDYCLSARPASAAAFLAFGTEGIVARLYEIFTTGLRRVGLGDDDLRFFLIHMACDDEHAATLAEMTASYGNEPGWAEAVRDGVRAALDLRLAFFDALYAGIRSERLRETMTKVQGRVSLAPQAPDASQVVFSQRHDGVSLYANRVERLGIEFAVERVPVAGDVLDPRIVRIPPGKANERHKHAHESFFFVVSGRGQVRVNDRVFRIDAGEMAFVPRWALHQTENIGDTELVILAITDFNFANKAYVGDYAHRLALRDQPTATAAVPAEIPEAVHEAVGEDLSTRN